MNPAPAPIRGIIFDLDGTLYPMRWYFKPLMFVRVLPCAMRLPRFLEVRETYAGVDFGSGDRLLAALSEEFAGREKLTSAEARTWIDRTFYPAFVAVMRFFRNSRPGLSELILTLRDRGIRLAVLSDYGRVAQRLENLHISPSLFDPVASCEEAGALKPNMRPFLEISRQWGIPPPHIVVVGDRPDTDGAAATSAGMRFVHVCDAGRFPEGGLRWRDARGKLRDLTVPPV